MEIPDAKIHPEIHLGLRDHARLNSAESRSDPIDQLIYVVHLPSIYK
jgi:hypothetical protein